jgi:hypothetical protein
MSASNGTAAPPILRLGDLSPDMRAVQVERAGQPVTLMAFIDGPRCPGYVKARVAKARQAYSMLVYVDGPPDEDGNRARIFQDDELAWDEYLRETLLAVIEGLLAPEAEVLAGNQVLAIDTLKALGWVRQDAEDAPPEGAGEAAAPSTTAGSSPDSAASTTSRRRRS